MTSKQDRKARREARLESATPGRLIQTVGVAFIALGIGFAVMDRLTCVALPIMFLNVITISAGLYNIFGPGRWMVNRARSHKAFMDDARKRIAAFDAEYERRVNGRWN